jgi:hypothetical protein
MRRLGQTLLIGTAALLLPLLAGAQEKPAIVGGVKPAPAPIVIKSYWAGDQRRWLDWFRPMDYFAQSAMPSLVGHESMPGGVTVATSSNTHASEGVIVAVSAEAQQTALPVYYQAADGKLHSTPQKPAWAARAAWAERFRLPALMARRQRPVSPVSAGKVPKEAPAPEQHNGTNSSRIR